MINDESNFSAKDQMDFIALREHVDEVLYALTKIAYANGYPIALLVSM